MTCSEGNPFLVLPQLLRLQQFPLDEQAQHRVTFEVLHVSDASLLSKPQTCAS